MIVILFFAVTWQRVERGLYGVYMWKSKISEEAEVACVAISGLAATVPRFAMGITVTQRTRVSRCWAHGIEAAIGLYA